MFLLINSTIDDFPEPFGPKIKTLSLFLIFKLKLFITLNPFFIAVTFSTSSQYLFFKRVYYSKMKIIELKRL